ncbi:MAG: threonine ammonia-lyase [bacterium]
MRLDMIDLREIEIAAARLEGLAVRTPLVRLQRGPGDTEIWLKLEMLQPLRSFKIRGAASVIRSTDRADLARGLVAASTGNLAQAVAWQARELGVPATIVIPDHAPAAKRDVLADLGARVIAVPLERWWQALHERGHPDADGLFIDPEDDRLIAGNGTIGLEVLDDQPDVDAVLVPYGGGALSAGIASAVKQLSSRVRVYAVEPETAAPANAALRAGRPVPIDYRPSWVDGCGGSALMPTIWPLVRPLLDGGVTVSLDDAAAAARLLVQRLGIVAEGAGALPVAAALAGLADRHRKIVCIVSGGNLDVEKLRTLLAGQTPG